MLRANPNPAIIDLFKVDRLQIFEFIYVSQLFISRMPKMLGIPNPTVAPEVRSQNT